MTKLRLKLIRDRWNSDRFQWRYYNYSVHLWFDYCDSFETRAEAITWRDNHDTNTTR